MNKKSDLTKLRDELALKYANDAAQNQKYIYIETINLETKAFTAGFDAGVAAERERAKVLVEALTKITQYYINDNGPLGLIDSGAINVAREALAAYEDAE